MTEEERGKWFVSAASGLSVWPVLDGAIGYNAYSDAYVSSISFIKGKYRIFPCGPGFGPESALWQSVRVFDAWACANQNDPCDEWVVS